MLLATAAVIDRLRPWTQWNASALYCDLFVATIGLLASSGQDIKLAVYSLSFWHYYLYWLAYRFGAVDLRDFKRDAIFMKSVSLGLAAWVYFSAAVDPWSLVVVAAGFLLNALGARALGSDRTYYGYELADLPRQRITRFPFSWISHPMLLGNAMAFGGLLLNPDFRRHWWPLACIHLGLNVGLLVMEIAIQPQRLAVRRMHDRFITHRAYRREAGIGFAAVCIALGAGFESWAASRTNATLRAIVAVCVSAYVYAIYRCYTAPGCGTEADHQPEVMR